MREDQELIAEIASLINNAIRSVGQDSIRRNLTQQYNTVRKTDINGLKKFRQRILSRYEQFINQEILSQLDASINTFDMANNEPNYDDTSTMNLNTIINNRVDIYSQLNISRDATDKEFRKAILDRITASHQDTNPNVSEEQRKILEQQVRYYNKLLNIFTKNNYEGRKKYDEWYDKEFDNKKEQTKEDLSELIKKAIETINIIGISEERKQQYINKIKNAKTKEEINNLILNAHKEKAINDIQNFDLEESDKNTFLNKINNCKKYGEIKQVILDAFKKYTEKKISSMNLNDEDKNYFKSQINNSNKLGEINKIIEDAAKKANKSNDIPKQNNPYPVPVEQSNKKQYEKPEMNISGLPTVQTKKTYEPPKIKVIDQKPSWLSRNWKKLLIAAGVASLAIVAAPYIVAPLMYLNSVAWHAFPALQATLHAINGVLGAVGSISPFANFSFAAGAGEWALNGLFFDNFIINSALPAAGTMVATITGISGIAADIGVGMGVSKLIKKAHKELNKIIKDIKKAKAERQEYINEMDRNGLDPKDFENTNSIKELYQQLKQKRKERKEKKKEKRKNGFVNIFGEKFKDIKEKLGKKKQEHDLSKEKALAIREISKYSNNSGFDNKILEEYIEKINNASSISEIDELQVEFEMMVDKQEKNESDNMKKPYIDLVKHCIDDENLKNATIEQIKNAKDMYEIYNIFESNNSLFNTIKIKFIMDNQDKFSLNDLSELNNAQTMEEFNKKLHELHDKKRKQKEEEKGQRMAA